MKSIGTFLFEAAQLSTVEQLLARIAYACEFSWRKDKDVLKYIDVLIDGQFKTELFDPRLIWKGSSNQRVIDVKKSLKKGNVVLLEEEE